MRVETNTPNSTLARHLRVAWDKLAGRAGWLSCLILFALIALTVDLDRFPEWDEAVFLSQSGDITEQYEEPALLVASRELGTPVLLKIIRGAVDGFSNTKIVWVVISLSCLAVAACLITRHLTLSPAGLIIGFGAHWISLLFITSFYSFFIAATAALSAVACYLSLRSDRDRQIRWGVLLGLALSVSFWFRQVESSLVVGVLLLHAILVSPGIIFRKRIKGVGTAVFVFLSAFAIPWVVDSTRRFGSVGERLQSGSSQAFSRGWSNQLGDYLDAYMGEAAHYAAHGPSPMWARLLVVAVATIALVLALIGFVRGRRSTKSKIGDISTMPLLVALGVVLVGFFAFYIHLVRDRYLLIGGIFVTVAVLEGISRWRAEISRSGTWIALLGMMSIGWLIANGVIAHTYDLGRLQDGVIVENYSGVLRSIAGDRSCGGVARYGAPRITFGSGCRTLTATSPEDASRMLSGLVADTEMVFLWWPVVNVDEVALPDGTWYQLSWPSGEKPNEPAIMWSAS